MPNPLQIVNLYMQIHAKPHVLTTKPLFKLRHIRNADFSASWRVIHPVNEEGLNELDDFERHLQTDGNEVVEEDDEGEEIEAEITRRQL